VVPSFVVVTGAAHRSAKLIDDATNLLVKTA